MAPEVALPPGTPDSNPVSAELARQDGLLKLSDVHLNQKRPFHMGLKWLKSESLILYGSGSEKLLLSSPVKPQK